jgi:hypothetical protein
MKREAITAKIALIPNILITTAGCIAASYPPIIVKIVAYIYPQLIRIPLASAGLIG